MRSLFVAVSTLLFSLGCSSNGAGVRATTEAPDASMPDLAMAPDLATPADLRPVPDTSPMPLPDAWQAAGIDLGTDTLPSVDSGSVDVLAATPDAPSCPVGKYLIYYSGITYCQAHQDADIDTRPRPAPMDTQPLPTCTQAAFPLIDVRNGCAGMPVCMVCPFDPRCGLCTL